MTSPTLNPNDYVLRDEMREYTQKMDSYMATQTQVLREIAVLNVELAHRDKAISALAADVSNLSKSQASAAILIAKAAGAAGLAGMLLPFVAKALMGS